MIALAVAVIWAGYGVASYGWVMLRGYDVPARAWWSPAHPYEWPPGGDPGRVPHGRIFPGSPPATAATTTGTAAPPPAAGGGRSGQGAPTGTTGSPVKPYG